MPSGATRDAVDKVLEEQRQGKWKSLREAAKASQLPRSTLGHRRAGRLSRAACHVKDRKLTPEEEDVLLEHIKNQTMAGFPMAVRTLRQLANVILMRRTRATEGSASASASASTSTSTDEAASMHVGINWGSRFCARCPEVVSETAQAREQLRASLSTPERVKAWFLTFEHVMGLPDVLPCNVYHMDEAGVQLGMLRTAQQTVARDSSGAVMKPPAEWESATVMECISATGASLHPTVVLRAKSHAHDWYPSDPSLTSHWTYAISPTGYTDDELSYLWISKVFGPQTAAVASGKPRILLVNGHRSHETEQFLTYCFANNILLCRLPAQTTHLTHPLTVGPLAALQTIYRDAVEHTSQGGARSLSKAEFVQMYVYARAQAFSRPALELGWRATGLQPRNLAIVMAKCHPPPPPPPPPPSTPPPLAGAADAPPTSPIKTPTNRAELWHLINEVMADKGLTTPSKAIIHEVALFTDRHMALNARLRKQIADLERENALLDAMEVDDEEDDEDVEVGVDVVGPRPQTTARRGPGPAANGLHDGNPVGGAAAAAAGGNGLANLQHLQRMWEQYGGPI